MLLVGAFAFLTISISSCSKQEYDATNATPQNVQAKLVKQVKHMTFALKTKDGGTVVMSGKSGMSQTNFSSGGSSSTYVTGESGNNFVEGGSGTNYSSGAEAGTSYDMRGTLNAGGGSFSLKGKTVNLDYVFCEDGEDLFDLGLDSTMDFKVLFGISGDFTDPENASLKYLVVMILIGDGSGNYKLDLDLLSGQAPNGAFGLIEVLDFSDVDPKSQNSFDEAKLYISTKGSLSASTGAYIYNNVDFSELKYDDNGDIDLGTKVKGAGNLLCQ